MKVATQSSTRKAGEKKTRPTRQKLIENTMQAKAILTLLV
jgi:hypothetical protein